MAENSNIHPYALEVLFWCGICIQISKQLKELQGSSPSYDTTSFYFSSAFPAPSYQKPFSCTFLALFILDSSRLCVKRGWGGGSRDFYFLTFILVPLESCHISEITQISLKFGDPLTLNSPKTGPFLFYHIVEKGHIVLNNFSVWLVMFTPRHSIVGSFLL